MDVLNQDVLKAKSREELIKQIKQYRKNIKNKHRSLQHEMLETDELWEKQLKPIAEPLNKLLEETGSNERKRKLKEDIAETPVKRYLANPAQGVKRKLNVNLLTHPDYDSDYEYDDGTLELPAAKKLAVPDNNMETEEIRDESEEEDSMDVGVPILQDTVYESPSTGESLIKTPQGKDLVTRYIMREFTGNIAKEYFIKLIKDTKSIDHNYGVRIDGDNWMIGDKKIDVIGDDLVVNGQRYTGTRGLYELIFMNIPNEFVYTEEDMKNYANILKDTNVYRVNNSALGKIKGNRGLKYRRIISRLVSDVATGTGISFNHRPKEAKRKMKKTKIEKNNNMSSTIALNPMTTYADIVKDATGEEGITLTDDKPNLQYWNDPNELVDRLRILHASKNTGNTAHDGEINSIIEELLELENEVKSQTGKSYIFT